jgi:sarcosine oxidase subunit gamma
MPEPQPIAASATQVDGRTHGDPARVLIRECGSRGAINLRLASLPPSGRGDNRDSLPPVRVGRIPAISLVQQCLGLALPTAPGWVEANGATLLWQAFDEWLLLTQDGAQDALLERLHGALAGEHASFVDVSDLYTAFEVSGASSRDLLAKGCALDLHPRAFRTGDCAPCAFARVRVTLRQLDDAPRFELLVERSYAHYLWDWLVDAAVEFVGG